MPLILPGNVGSATAAVGYDVDNSCRLQEAVMHITPGSEGDTQKMTLSMWVKRGELGVEQQMWHTQNGSNQATTLVFGSNDKLYFIADDSNKLITTRVFRDPSAWYHIVLAIDTTNGTAGNRARLYVNGVEETVFDTDSAPSEDQALQWTKTTSHRIGSQADTANNAFNGYLAEVVWIDGTQYAASDFGEFDSDSPTIWKPKKVSTLTFGTNGFYLDFKASDNLGNDANGGTDLTEVSIAATDQSTDTPTNSFCTINPLDEPYGTVTLTEGNLRQIQSSNYPYNRSTIGVAKGKWYWEGLCVTTSNDATMGIVSHASASDTDYIHATANNYGYYNHVANHGAYSAGSAVDQTNYDAYTDDDVISVAMDLDNNKLYFAKNGTWANSGDPTSGSTGTGAVSITAAASTADGFYFPSAADYGGSPRTTWSMNFGSPAHAISSGNADADGYGNFEYAVPSGYYELCTKNLAEYG